MGRVDPGWLFVLWSLQVARKPADDEVSPNSQNAAVLKLDVFERLIV